MERKPKNSSTSSMRRLIATWVCRREIEDHNWHSDNPRVRFQRTARSWSTGSSVRAMRYLSASLASTQDTHKQNNSAYMSECHLTRGNPIRNVTSSYYFIDTMSNVWQRFTNATIIHITTSSSLHQPSISERRTPSRKSTRHHGSSAASHVERGSSKCLIVRQLRKTNEKEKTQLESIPQRTRRILINNSEYVVKIQIPITFGVVGLVLGFGCWICGRSS